MLRLRDSNVTVPDKFRYRFPDGWLIHAFGKEEWIEKTKKYASDNGYTIPSIEEMEDQLCRTLSGEWCLGGDQYSFVSNRFTIDDFLRGMKTLGRFVLTGQVVSQEVADQRAEICSRCPINMSVPGCSSCTGMVNAIMDMKGAKTTKYDHLLKACGICHCSNEAQVWVPNENLAKSVTPEMHEKYQRIEGCWKKELPFTQE